MSEGIELRIYRKENLAAHIAVLGNRWKPAALDELNRDGGGSFSIRVDDPIFEELPDLLEYTNVVQVLVDGRPFSVFEIMKKREVLVSNGEFSEEHFEVSGKGLRTWLSHASVVPEGGMTRHPKDRTFSFATAEGSWYVPAHWVPTVAKTLPRPEAWPANLSQTWIGTSVNGAGDSYFRQSFTTTKTEKVKIYATAADYAAIFVDGERVITISQFGAKGKTFEAEFQLPSGQHIIAVRQRNEVPNTGAVTYALVKGAGDTAVVEDIVDADRLVWSTAGTGVRVNPYPTTPPGWTIGQIVNRLMDEAEFRGVQSIQRLNRGWTDSADSYGEPWDTTHEMVFGLGDTYADVATLLSDSYVDIWFDPDFTMHMAPERGRDLTAGPEQVAFRTGLSILNADVDATAEISNVALVATATGLVEKVGPSDSVAKYGRRETFLSAVNASEDGRAPYLIDQLFRKFATPQRTPTLAIYPREGSMPMVDFGVGDWVLAPSDDSAFELIRRRIVSLSVGESSSTGLALWTAEIDTIETSVEERFARWLQSIENAGKSGGVSGTSTTTTGSSTEIGVPGSGGTPPLPPEYNPANPSSPANLQVSAAVALAPGGYSRGTASLSWEYNGLDVDGRPAPSAGSDVGYQRTGSTDDWTVITSVSGQTTALVEDLAISSGGVPISYTFAVRTVGSNGRRSDWSQAVSVTMVEDKVAPAVPFFEAGDITSHLRTVTARWGGKLTGAGSTQISPPADFDYVRLWQSASSSMAGKVEVGRSSYSGLLWQSPGGMPLTTLWYAVSAVDRSGNESALSPARSVTVNTAYSIEEVFAKIPGELIDSDLPGESLYERLEEGRRLTALAAARNTVSLNLPVLSDGQNRDTGSTWTRINAAGAQIGFFRWNGTGWVSMALDPLAIPLINIGSGTAGLLDVSRFSASTAAISQAVIDKLYVDVVRSRLISAEMIAVMDLADFGPTLAADSPSRGWKLTAAEMTQVDSTLSATGWGIKLLNSSAVVYGPTVPVKAGEKIALSVRVQKNTTATAYAVMEWLNPDGTRHSFPARTAFSSAVGTFTMTANNDVVPVGAAMARVHLYALNETGAGTESIIFADVKATKLVGATLIEPGGITTPAIAAGAVTADELDVGSARTAILVSNVVKTEHLDADAITAKHRITGALVQTSATTNRGVKIIDGGITAWSDAGAQNVTIGGPNGDITATRGTLTGLTYQTTATANRGVKITTAGLKAYSSAGALTADIGSGTTNYLVGNFGTNTGQSRQIRIENTSDLGEAVIFILRDNWVAGMAGDEAGIYLTNIDDLVLRAPKARPASDAPRTVRVAGRFAVYDREVGIHGLQVVYYPDTYRYRVNCGFPATSDLSVNGDLYVTGAKAFVIEHPSKEGMELAHGATESPVSGVEYWGNGVTGEDGTAVVALPDYFEALTKPGNRAVLVAAQGYASWSEIVDGKFTVTSNGAGVKFSWLVKAERAGADFVVEREADHDFGGSPEETIRRYPNRERMQEIRKRLEDYFDGSLPIPVLPPGILELIKNKEMSAWPRT